MVALFRCKILIEVAYQHVDNSSITSFMKIFWQVSKSPSDSEIALTIIRNSSRGFLERDKISAARKQLDLLEVWLSYLSSLYNLNENSSLFFDVWRILYRFCFIFLYYHPFMMVNFSLIMHTK